MFLYYVMQTGDMGKV